MRIADIVASQLRPGTVVVDRTSGERNLTPSSWVPPEHEVVYSRDAASGGAPALFLHDLVAPDAAVALGAAVAGVSHVVLFDRLPALLEHGLLEQAADGGWELAATHVTGHDELRFGVVFTAPAAAVERARLRLLNEYRFEKLCLRVAHDELGRAEVRLADEVARRAAAEAAVIAAADQHAAYRAEAESVTGRLRERLLELERRLARVTRLAAGARGSLAFRVGRATRVALRDAASRPLAVPGRWLATFRGPDELLAELDQD